MGGKGYLSYLWFSYLSFSLSPSRVISRSTPIAFRKSPVVAHHQQRAVIFGERGFQHLDRDPCRDGWSALVEQQQPGRPLARQYAGECGAEALAAG